jgi:hypothetical protein
VPPSEEVAVTDNVANCPDVRFNETGCEEIVGAAALIFVVTETCELSAESSLLIVSPTAVTETMYDVLSAMDAYVEVVRVVDVPLMPDFVPSSDVPAAL